VYPAHVSTKTYSYDPASLDVLSLNIPTGSITVHTCPKAKNVTVTVTSGSKNADELQEIVLDVKEAAKSLSISAKAPSFDLQHCHIIHVSVVIPADSTHPLSLSAKADVGYIRLKTKEYTFDKVDLSVNVGVVRAKKVSAKDISATASIGGVVGCTWNASETVTVNTGVGGACLNAVTAKQSLVTVQNGYLRVCNSESAEWNSTVGYGYMVLNNLLSKSVNSEINYGKMWVTPSNEFAGSVVFTTENHGHLEITAKRGIEPPAVVDQISAGFTQKSAKLVDNKKHDGNGKLNLKSVSGNVFLFVPNSSE